MVYTLVPYDGEEMELNEISQETELRFAFAVAEGTELHQQHPFVLCRDYLGDAVYARRTGHDFCAFGFETDNVRLEKDSTLLLCEYTGRRAGIIDMIAKMNDLESDAGLALTRRHIIGGEGDTFLIKADKAWSATPQAISLFTFLLRVGAGLQHPLRAYVSIDDLVSSLAIFETNDGGYATQFNEVDKKFVRKFVINHKTLMDPALVVESEYSDPDYFHDSGGIATLADCLAGEEISYEYVNNVIDAARKVFG